MPNVPKLIPEDQFPTDAIKQSIQVMPEPTGMGSNGSLFLTVNLASAADMITPWGISPRKRDQELRKFWPTESYLAGALANVSFRNSVFDWEIKGPSNAINVAVTEMLTTALAGDSVGWIPFVQKYSQDLYSQDNGAFIELIRDPGMDANSRFKDQLAPVIGIAHMDSGQCVRTGNPEYPVIYTDREDKQHKLHWYEVIPFSDFPSPIEKMNGIGVCSVSRALRMAQIMRSIAIFKDEEVSGRNVRKINIVGGVSVSQIEDAIRRTKENADNKGLMRYIEHVVLASLDPEKPVSVETVDLASLPEGFNYDQEMQWYIAALALDFAVDYQEFAPLPGGNIGSAAQSGILHKKTSGKGPRTWMDSISNAFKIYGVIPRGTVMQFNDKNEQEEMEKQEIRTKALEEAAIAVNSKILTPEAAARDLVRRGIYDEETIVDIPDDWWTSAVDAAKNESKKQLVGDRGGNTLAEDAGRTDSGKSKANGGGSLRKMFDGSYLVEIMEKLANRKPDTITITPPAVNVINEVKPAVIPRPIKQRQIVNRDSRGNIESTDTFYEY